jgi:hypothetical protein
MEGILYMSSTKTTETNFVSDNIETEIPSWVLPREEITFYVKIKNDTDFSKIQIDVPDCFEIKDFINVLEHNSSENMLEVTKIGRSTLSKKDYFGITIVSKEIFDDLATQREIKIKMFETNGNISDISTFVRIFRPHLEIDQIPQEISLNDVEETTLPLHLKFKGFGDISIRIEANIGGSLVSEGGRSVMDRLFHGFLQEGLFDAEFEEIDEQGIVIDKTKLVRAFDEIKTKLKDVEYMKELEKDKEITQEAIEWIKSFNETEQGKFMNVLYETMEGYMIKKLTDVFARNVSRHLQIDSGTNIIAEIKAKLTELHVKIFYKDLAGNTYQELKSTVRIVDKREKDTQLRVVIPIDIEHVNEDGAYKNVSVMEIPNVV